jgi:hypothetical protein
MNRRAFGTMLAFSPFAFMAAPRPAAAQSEPPRRIRGVIASVAGPTMTVTTRDGQTTEIRLTEPLTVTTVRPVALNAIAPGSYVGTATRSTPHGSLQAIEVLVFPEAMRGAGEGNRPWDLEPGSMMTNGTVSGVVDAASGRNLSITFKDGKKDVHVTPDAPIVTLAPAERTDLKPGAPVFLTAARNAEGQLAASRVTVGKDGVAPPM